MLGGYILIIFIVNFVWGFVSFLYAIIFYVVVINYSKSVRFFFLFCRLR